MKGLIDSTLREGSQTFGLAFTLAQKKEIFSGLCSVGIEEIEIGLATPLDNDLPELMEFCRVHGGSRRLALWSRCRREDIAFARSLQPDVLSLSIPVSDIHIEKKFDRDRNWALEAAKTSIREAHLLGFKVISLGLEDATRANHGFLKNIVQIAIAEGVNRVRLADTVGIANPLEFADLVRSIKSLGSVEVGVHTHNDFGMATANSLAALDAGAEWADATVLGLGERAGNAHMEELASYLTLHRANRYRLESLAGLAGSVAEMSGRAIEPYRPIVGKKIFYCETGLHIQGLKKDTSTYEPFPPEIVGARRKLQLGSKIGRKDILNCLGPMKKNTANCNLEKVALSVREKAGERGRPLKRREILAIITSAFSS